MSQQTIAGTNSAAKDEFITNPSEGSFSDLDEGETTSNTENTDASIPTDIGSNPQPENNPFLTTPAVLKTNSFQQFKQQESPEQSLLETAKSIASVLQRSEQGRLLSEDEVARTTRLRRLLTGFNFNNSRLQVQPGVTKMDVTKNMIYMNPELYKLTQQKKKIKFEEKREEEYISSLEAPSRGESVKQTTPLPVTELK